MYNWQEQDENKCARAYKERITRGVYIYGCNVVIWDSAYWSFFLFFCLE